MAKHIIPRNINFDKKFVFIHIPKTAGMAIGAAVGKRNPAHFEGKEIAKRLASKSRNDSIDNYFKFTFVRNPWDRFLSLYFYCKAGSEMFGLRPRARYKGSFESFCEAFYSGNFFKSYAVWGDHYKEQWKFIDGVNMDFIGRFENLQEDFNKLCKHLKLPQKQVPHKNKSQKHDHYSNYYTTKTREMIAKKYAKDIEYFGYEFGE